MKHLFTILALTFIACGDPADDDLQPTPTPTPIPTVAPSPVSTHTLTPTATGGEVTHWD